jgi:hypothetical protein
MSPQPPNCPWRVEWTLSRADTGQEVRVRLTEDSVRHFYNGHVNNPDRPDERRRWAFFLEETTTQLLTRLDNCWRGAQAVRNVLLDEVAIRLEKELHQAFAAPRFIEYEETDLSGNHRHDTLELPSPSGVIIVLRKGMQRSSLQTAFFPAVPDSATAKQLRKKAIHDLVDKYAPRITYAGYSYRTLPQPTDKIAAYEDGAQVGWRTNIRFVDPAKWGFVLKEPPGPPTNPEWIWP